MASDLLSIAASGARAARGALDVTAQNIANASSDGYVRRSVRMEEVSSAGGQLRIGDISLSELVDALNLLGTSPSDLVAILEALKQAGSLKAEMVVI